MRKTDTSGIGFLKASMWLFLLIPIFLSGENSLSLSPVQKETPAALFKEGEKLRQDGRFEEAAEVYTRCLELSGKTGDRNYELDSNLALGVVYWNLGKLEESREFYTSARALAKKLADEKREKRSFACLEIHRFYDAGKKALSSGKYQEATASFEQAIDLARKIKSPDHEVKCLRLFSFVYWDQNNYNDFYSINNMALKIAIATKNKREEGGALNNLGMYYWKIDNYASALNTYEKALEIAQEGNNVVRHAKALHNIGLMWNYLGNYDKALEYLIKAYNLDQQLGNKSELALDLNNIGMAQIKKGILSSNENDLEKAKTYFKESLRLAGEANDKKTEVFVLSNMGSLKSHQMSFSEALDYFQLALKKAEDIHDLNSLGMIYNNIGIVYANEGQYEESTAYYEKAIQIAVGIKGGEILWEAYLEKANALKNQKKYEEAIKNYISSIKIIEKIRLSLVQEELKASYLGTDKRMDAYQGLIDLLAGLHLSRNDKTYGIDAFNYLEKAKARAFLDSLEVSQVQVLQGVNFKLLNEEKEIMREISELYTKLLLPGLSPEEKTKINDQLTLDDEKLEALKREIRTTSPAYADLKYPRVITFDEVRAEPAGKKTAFFAYSLGKERSFGFAIGGNDFTIFPLPARDVIQRQVAEYRKVISDKDNSDFGLGSVLYEELVRPGLFPGIKNIVVIPDDILNLLPFETLVPDKEKKKWLVEDFAVSYAPSLSSLRQLNERKRTFRARRSKDLLAFGDPFYGINEDSPKGQSSDLSQDFFSNPTFHFFRLKYSGLETRKIAALFRASRVDVFERREATEDRLKSEPLADYKILHFATHGLIDDKKPARSSIILALDQEPAEDGFLQMREAFNLNLNADLVVLSACQTGLGQFIRGEGIEGLSRAFFYAGTSAVLMSLWAVNDQATYQLMERFYRHLRSAAPPMDALRKAKLEMIGSGTLSHPYYWAGFILNGKTDTVIFRGWFMKGITPAAIFGAAVILLFVLKRRKRGKARFFSA